MGLTHLNVIFDILEYPVFSKIKQAFKHFPVHLFSSSKNLICANTSVFHTSHSASVWLSLKAGSAQRMVLGEISQQKVAATKTERPL